MKYLILSILSLLASIHIKAQQNTNKTYLQLVGDDQSQIVSQLERHIANYDISAHSIYDNSEKSWYQITFKDEQSELIVNYNAKGEIITSKENYKNIKLPYAIASKITRDFPSWRIEHNTYKINYSRNRNVHKVFSIRLSKGVKTKTIKIDSNKITERSALARLHF